MPSGDYDPELDFSRFSELPKISNQLLHRLKGPPSTTVTSALGPKESIELLSKWSSL